MGKDNKIKTVNEWLNRDDLEQGYTIMNAKFSREYSDVYRALRKWAKYLYFLGVEMGNYYCTKMMYSARRQSKFCGAVCAEMKTKKVDYEHVKVFEKDIKSLKRRLETIERITNEDIHLSPYEPFFQTIEDVDELDFREIADMARKWNEEHKDLVEKHMEAISPELERHNEFLRRKTEAIKAEKEARKQAKKAEDEYVKEILANRKKHRARSKRVEKSFEKYYRGEE